VFGWKSGKSNPVSGRIPDKAGLSGRISVASLVSSLSLVIGPPEKGLRLSGARQSKRKYKKGTYSKLGPAKRSKKRDNAKRGSAKYARKGQTHVMQSKNARGKQKTSFAICLANSN
jgi:hypothetical protein